MSASEQREQLAMQQSNLVRALTGQGLHPAGFETARLQAAARSLLRKRMQSVAIAWPRLAKAMGEPLREKFAAYAATTPLPGHGGALADGRAFVRFLNAARELPDEGRLEAMAIDLRFVKRRGALVPRSGPAMRVALLPRRGKIVLAARIPWIGEKWLQLP